MAKKVIDDECLNQFVSSLMEQGYTVVAPRKEGRRIVYGEVETGADFLREYTNPQDSPKNLLFPRREEMLSFTDDGEVIEVVPDEDKTVLLGVRPCDAMAVTHLDKIFNWDYRDTYYNRRRRNTILIGLACNKPDPTCFCTSLGNGLGPHQKENVDMMLTRLDDRSYLVEAVSKVGEELLSLITCGARGGPSHDEKALELKERAEKMITKKLDVDTTFKVLDDNFDSDYWKDVARKCIGCGICTYLCPTCYCFDIQDEGTSRFRFWDSCQFSLYAKHATGHNPRDQHFKRYRNRVYHKFVYFKKNFDAILCVGCGRCKIYCPMKVDIFKIVSEAEVNVVKLERGEMPE
jgi:sulfhydrogenase subunit beta (sulfur reductase)